MLLPRQVKRPKGDKPAEPQKVKPKGKGKAKSKRGKKPQTEKGGDD